MPGGLADEVVEFGDRLDVKDETDNDCGGYDVKGLCNTGTAVEFVESGDILDPWEKFDVKDDTDDDCGGYGV